MTRVFDGGREFVLGSESIVDVEHHIIVASIGQCDDPMGLLGEHTECPTVDIEHDGKRSFSLDGPCNVELMVLLAGVPVGDVPDSLKTMNLRIGKGCHPSRSGKRGQHGLQHQTAHTLTDRNPKIVFEDMRFVRVLIPIGRIHLFAVSIHRFCVCSAISRSTIETSASGIG